MYRLMYFISFVQINYTIHIYIYKMVEAIANSAEDYLIEGLNFKLSPGASYITDRKSVCLFFHLVVQIISAGKGHV